MELLHRGRSGCRHTSLQLPKDEGKKRGEGRTEEAGRRKREMKREKGRKKKKVDGVGKKRKEEKAGISFSSRS